MSHQHIAVTTDFSAESRLAFPRAAAVARRFGAELELVHLAQMPLILSAPWPEVGPYMPVESTVAEVERRLEELRASEPAFAGLKTATRVVRGEAIEALREHLASAGADLVVVASHGHSGLKKLLLGSFAERLLRVSPAPVLVSRTTEPASGDFSPRRILVPYDFSPCSRAALSLARDWARAFGARARLVFVAEATASLYDYASNMQGSFAEYLGKVRTEALSRLGRLIREEWSGIEAEGVALSGDPVAEILREAQEGAADLIVLGTHSRSGLERFFLGSVTQKLAQRSPVSVLAVRGT
jgi:nucleotide-binding universal stress UspA family protein